MILLIAAAGLGFAQEAACDSPTSLAQLDRRIEQAETAWVALDLPRFRSAADDLAGVLPCVDTPLTVPRAAQVHRLQGMRAFVQSDTPRAELAFAAARRLTPGQPLDDRLAPANHPIRRHYSALPIDDLGEVRIDHAGTCFVDGTASGTRPTHLPSLVQHLGADGAVSQGWYLWPGESPVLAPVHPGIGRWLALGGGAALVAAGGTYLGAVATEGRYMDRSTARAALDGLRRRTNALVWTSGGLAAVGVGLAAATFTVDW